MIPVFEVVFLDYDSSVLKTDFVWEGGSATPPPNPQRNGYLFTGWSPSDFSNVTASMTVTAQYEIKTYEVLFDSKGGNLIPGQTVDHGALLTAPGKPVRDGYYFINWYKDEDLTDVWHFATDQVYEDMTLYAKWLDAGTVSMLAEPSQVTGHVYFNDDSR